jgi:hypothetical protein
VTVLTKIMLGVETDEEARALVLGTQRKDASFEMQHPRYPKGHPRAGKFMEKPDLEAFKKLKPIRDLIDKMPTGRHRSSPPINHALDTIDKVLRLPNPSSGAKLSIVASEVRAEGGAEANYDYKAKQVNLFDTRKPSDDDPDVFVTEPFASLEGASATVAHEIAHWIDNELLAEPLGAKDEHAAHDPEFFASGIQIALQKAANVPEGQRTPAQEALLEWGYSVFTSRPYTHLTSLRGKNVTVSVNGKSIDVEVPPKLIDYLTNAPELWARSFEQYLANETRDPAMLTYVTAHRRRSDAAPISLPNYWTPDEFWPIRDAFGKLFAALGWRVPQTQE